MGGFVLKAYSDFKKGGGGLSTAVSHSAVTTSTSTMGSATPFPFTSKSMGTAKYLGTANSVGTAKNAATAKSVYASKSAGA